MAYARDNRMVYRPCDHIPSRRSILAAWILCAVIGGLGLLFPALSHKAATPADEASKLSIADCLCAGAAPSAATLPRL
jgi:hypothetical protein